MSVQEADVALIAGGTSGLGLAVARRLLDGDHRIVLMGRSRERAEKARAELGGEVHVACGDVASPDDVAAALATAGGLGRLGAVVNCAGSARSRRVVSSRGPMPLAEFEDLVRSNLVGTFNLVRLAAEAMIGNIPREDGRGVIVCTSSIAAYDGQAGQAAYAASKAGVVGMTLPLARDLARYGVRVVTVAPGLFDTPMFATLDEEARRELVAATPFPTRLGRPDEFGGLVEHIVRNPMINGEVIRIDGGTRLGHP
ncbi:SDR family NAD(P)-dependent oxidoreductase [Streptomyces sp.]|uniref:SDR family NAD(P)-dependent oxidoreductase n=1 Tax=Streptomyces sp. TaxID=1931 RepID=UPI002F417DAB